MVFLDKIKEFCSNCFNQKEKTLLLHTDDGFEKAKQRIQDYYNNLKESHSQSTMDNHLENIENQLNYGLEKIEELFKNETSRQK